jgi:predicted DNA-binding protein (MmcQ/YjbR family)
VTRDELAAYCLAKPGAWLDEPWEGDEVVKVGDKIFVFLGAPDARPESIAITLKCGVDAEEAGELRRRFPDDVTMSRYIGRHGWNTVRVDGAMPADEIQELIDASYDAIVAKLPRSKRP